MNGRTGQFVIGRDGSIITLEHSKLKIARTDQDLTAQGIRTTIQRFTIIDENGIEYVFAAVEKTEILKMKVIATGQAYGREYANMAFERQDRKEYTIDKWWLTEIKNPLTGEKILFEYDDPLTDVSPSKDGSYERFQNTDFITWTTNRTVSYTKRVNKITCPDGHWVRFYYGSDPATGYTERVDLPGEARLNEIRIGYNTSMAYSYFLTHGYLFKKEVKSYSYSFADADKKYARLCLTGIKRDGQPPYQFEYYTGAESADLNEIVPPYKCYAVDHWGYYNKATVAGPFSETPDIYALTYQASANRAPQSGFAKLGLLKKVTNPFNGSLVYEYEQNTYYSGSANILVGGVRVSKTTAYDDVNAANNAIVEYKYDQGNGASSGWGYETPSYQRQKEVYIENDPPFNKYPAGGLLVADYKRALITSAIKTVVNMVLKQVLANVIAATTVSGQIYIAVILIIVDLIIEYASWLLDQTDIYTLTSYDFFYLGSANAISFQYDRVEVRSISPGIQLGRTVSEFRSPRTMSEAPPSALAAPYSGRMRYGFWKYGLPLKITDYDQNGVPVKEVINNYNIVEQAYTNANFYSAKMITRRTYSMRDPICLCYNGSNYDFDYDFYYPIVGRVELESTTERYYKGAGNYAEQVTKYEYNSQNYQVKTIYKTDSRGVQQGQSIYYPVDYTLTGAVQTLKEKNILNVPLATATWKRTCTSCNKQMLSATVTEYTSVNGNIKPANTYVFENSTPLDNTFLVSFDPVNLFNYSYLKQKSSHQYEWSTGNLLQANDVEGGKVSYIYDHNNRAAVARVSNAAKDEIAYSSFEADGKGNWVYNESDITESVLCVTGVRCFTLSSSNNISTTVLITRPSVLTLWADAAGVMVNGSITATRTGPTINGWTYMEFELPANASSPVITGAGVHIDELRLYPAGAFMSSVTVVPLLGKTSECDENNRILYYEHDGYGRLFKIKDAYRNLIKTYEYRYKNQ